MGHWQRAGASTGTVVLALAPKQKSRFLPEAKLKPGDVADGVGILANSGSMVRLEGNEFESCGGPGAATARLLAPALGPPFPIWTAWKTFKR